MTFSNAEHPGGCDHCVGPCGRADFGAVTVAEHRGAYNSVWYGQCPACAEAKRNAALLLPDETVQAREHCEHCDPECAKWDDERSGRGRNQSDAWMADYDHFDANHVMWDDGDCPACAERKKIVALLRAALDWLVDDQDGWLIDELTQHIAVKKVGPEMDPKDVVEQILSPPHG